MLFYMSNLPFIITRALEDSVKLSEFVEDKGFDVILSPLTEIDYEAIDWQPYLANEKINLIFTSFHAAKKFPWDKVKHIEHLFFIGKNSYQKIKEIYPDAYKNVAHTHLFSSINELIADFNVKKAVYKNLEIFYFRGQHIRQDLHQIFKDDIKIEDIVVYKAREVLQLNQDVLTLLESEKQAVVAFMSKRAVEIWFEALEHYNLMNSCRNLITLSFSKTIHEAVVNKIVCYDNYYCIEPSYHAFCDLILRLKTEF